MDPRRSKDIKERKSFYNQTQLGDLEIRAKEVQTGLRVMRCGGSFETEFAIQCHVCKSEGVHVMPLPTSFPLSSIIDNSFDSFFV